MHFCWKAILSFVSVFIVLNLELISAQVPRLEYSKTGIFPVDGSGREVSNFNVGWRFKKGQFENAHQVDFDDSSWQVVSCPHGLEDLPAEASGGRNYQGPAWYRKRFTPSSDYAGKLVSLYFEAVMGRSKIWINGEKILTHTGGYLPFSASLTGKLKLEQENVIVVYTDNSDDPIYPPGKPQNGLDFSYFGGIYRDVWLVTTNHVYVTDANQANQVAGGGLFFHCESATKEQAKAKALLEVANESSDSVKVIVKTRLIDQEGLEVSSDQSTGTITSSGTSVFSHQFVVANPKRWTPNSPHLYDLFVTVTDTEGNNLDGFREKVGLRTIEFRGEEGLYLNGELVKEKIIGGNRHQDYAYVGNALPNSGQWRDAKKMRDAGMTIVRAGHYPMDPAFMDACDALGLFMIVPTPGWQFYNKDPRFGEHVIEDIRQMVRRDRNHPSVLWWEPILNEAHYPVEFGHLKAATVHEEYPFSGAYAASDISRWNKGLAAGWEVYDLLYFGGAGLGKCGFIREFGDNVDDFGAHNSNSRAAYDWGERAQVVQALQYQGALNLLLDKPSNNIGGALWATFDHQRGYHPDPFYGGIMDAFRRKKYSYHFFASQRNPEQILDQTTSGPMVFLAHELTPFSGNDMVVFSNCEEVRLSLYGKEVGRKRVKPGKLAHPAVVFEDVFQFQALKSFNRGPKPKGVQVSAIVEGLIGGKVVARQEVVNVRAPSKIKLELDNDGIDLVADGSDFVPIIASIVDSKGRVKRLNNENIYFEVQGEGSLIGGVHNGANPRIVEWGSAPALIRASTKPGKITVTARVLDEGSVVPKRASLEFESIAPKDILIYQEEPTSKKQVLSQQNESEVVRELTRKLQETQRKLNAIQLKEVQRDQEISPADSK